MKHTIPHRLGDVAQARGVVEEAYAEYERKLASHDPRLTWTSDSVALIEFTVMSKTLSVQVRLTDHDLTVEGKLPLLFRPFQGKILGVLEREVDQWSRRAEAREA